jgi:hypothetical protein
MAFLGSARVAGLTCGFSSNSSYVSLTLGSRMFRLHDSCLVLKGLVSLDLDFFGLAFYSLEPCSVTVLGVTFLDLCSM